MPLSDEQQQEISDILGSTMHKAPKANYGGFLGGYAAAETYRLANTPKKYSLSFFEYFQLVLVCTILAYAAGAFAAIDYPLEHRLAILVKVGGVAWVATMALAVALVKYLNGDKT